MANLKQGQQYRSPHGKVTYVGPGKNGAIVQSDAGQLSEVPVQQLLPWLGDIWLVVDRETLKSLGVVRTKEAANQRAADPLVVVLPYRQA